MKTSTRKKINPGTILLVVFVIAILVIVVVLLERLVQRTTAGFGEGMDLQKVDDHPLYVLRYPGDYGFDEFLKTGLQDETGKTTRRSDGRDWGCSVFAALSPSGNPRLGRNFDWNDDPALLLFTDPPNAFASVSMVDIAYLGFDKATPSRQDRLRLVDAPFLPFDGMNEVGVAIGMMAVPLAEGGRDPQKVTIGSLHAIRLVLDHAKNVDQAIALLQGYNIDFEEGPPIHYLIADSIGNSVVVEYLDDRLVVTRNDQHWQVATNFILSGLTSEMCESSCWRYQKAYQTLSQAGGKLS
ncbi:MAG: C45 family peptidase, partial [Anaerolineaceae bacterium]